MLGMMSATITSQEYRATYAPIARRPGNMALVTGWQPSARHNTPFGRHADTQAGAQTAAQIGGSARRPLATFGER